MALQGTFGSGGEVAFNLRIDTSQARSDVDYLLENFNKLSSIAQRYLVIARKLGMPDEVDAVIQKISMAILAFRQLEQAIIQTQAVLAGTGPLGWAILGASWGYTALSFYSIGNQ